MTVKELYKKYKDYTIMLFGVPLAKKSVTTPFTRLPKNKNLDDCIVVELEVCEEPVDVHSFDIELNYIGTEKTRGNVYAHIQ